MGNPPHITDDKQNSTNSLLPGSCLARRTSAGWYSMEGGGRLGRKSIHELTHSSFQALGTMESVAGQRGGGCESAQVGRN